MAHDSSDKFQMRIVRPGTEEAEVARLLARSFADAHNTVYMFFDPALRVRALPWFFARRLRLAKAVGGTILGLFDISTNTCVSTITITPNNVQATVWHWIWQGMLVWPLLWGFDSFRRCLDLKKEISRASRTAKGGRCNMELLMLATSPEHQGQGHGRRLLSEALASLDSGISVGLSTQTESNIKFYEKIGFVVTSENHLLEGQENSFMSWTMRLDK